MKRTRRSRVGRLPRWSLPSRSALAWERSHRTSSMTVLCLTATGFFQPLALWPRLP